MRKILLIIILNFTFYHAQQINPFYLGHSLVNFDMPAMVDGLAESAGKTSIYNQQIINGSPLKYNYDNYATAQGLSYRTAFPSGGFTHFVVTEAVPLKGHLMYNDTYGYANNFYNYAKNNNNGLPIKFYIYETWHCINTGTPTGCAYDNDDALTWQTRLQSDFPLWTGIVNHVRSQNVNEASSILLVPAGQAFYNLTTRINAGNVPGITSYASLFSDDIHLTNKGNYFVACVMYATIFKESPVGLSTNLKNQYGVVYTDMPTQQQASVMQQVAWETVSSLNSWTGVTSLNNDYFVSNDSFQIAPNPVNNQLEVLNNSQSNQINFEIRNILGNVIKKGNTSNSIIITDELVSGIYFITLDNLNNQETFRFIKQ